MGYPLSNAERTMFQQVFGADKSPEHISLGAFDPEDEDTVYFSEISNNAKTLFTFEFDSPLCVEQYSVIRIQHESISFLIADFVETILIGVTAKPTDEFFQLNLIEWWHGENNSPATRFCIEDERIFSTEFVRRLMDNKIRTDFMTDAEFDDWLAKNLA
jgi:hypothetical protein